MANRYAVADGNWSNTATWDGGTLPTSADVVRPNNFSVTIDQNITVQALRNDASSPAVAGGTFTLTGNYTVNISIDIQCFATSLFIYDGTGTAYITGTNAAAAIISSTTTNTTNTITHSGTGHLIVDMVMNSTVLNEVNRTNLYVSGGGILTCLKLVSSTFLNFQAASASQTILVANTNGAILNLKSVNCKTLGYCTVRCNSQCTLNINGDVTVSVFGYDGGTLIMSTIITSATTVINIVGNIYSDGTLTQGQQHRAININANSIINMIGDVLAAPSNAFGAMIFIASGISNITITGNLLGAASGGGYCVNLNLGSLLTLTGNTTGGLSQLAILSSGTVNITGTIQGGTGNGVQGVSISGGALNHVGIVQASAFGSGIGCTAPATSNVTCTGPFLRNGYILAVASQTLRINSLYNPYFEFKKSDATDVTYVDQSGSNFPATANVRQGTSYASGLYTGTLAVPLPSNVRVGIATDNTVGTADLTAEDMWNYLTSNTFASGSMGDRMKNVSTVASTGAQIASYNV